MSSPSSARGGASPETLGTQAASRKHRMRRLAKHVHITLCVLALLLLEQTAVAADLNGKWDFVFDTEVGIYESSWTLTVNGDKVTAKQDETVLTGTFRDGKLALSGEFYAAEAGYAAEMKISGKLESDQFKGDASWDVYEMTFTATRAE